MSPTECAASRRRSDFDFCLRKTITAGLVIGTGWPGPLQRMVSFAATGADAHRVVKQAAQDAGDHGKAQAPGATGERFAGTAFEYPRRRIWPRSTICMKPALTFCGKRGCTSIAAPTAPTGKASTSSTTCTACGLPIDMAVMACFAVDHVERINRRLRIGDEMALRPA